MAEKNTSRQLNPMQRGLIISAIALVVVGALIALFLLLPEKDTVDPDASPSDSYQPIETFYIINDQFTKLDKLEVFDADGRLINTMTASAPDPNDPLNIVYSVSPDREGWNYDQELLRTTAVSVSTFAAVSKVAEDPSDLAQYGLDKPTWTIRATYDSGDRMHSAKIGAPTALNDSYYCLAEDGNVYAVGAYATGNIVRTEMDYRTYRFFPDYYDKTALEVQTNGEITYVRLLDEENGYELLLRKTEEGEFENAPSQMRMEAPVECFASEDQAETRVINLAVLININGIYIDDPTEEQIAECGLDKPKEVWLKNDSGEEVHYLIGKTVNGNAYAMVEGLDTILTADGIANNLFSINYVDVMFKMLLDDNVRDVDKVEFDLPDGRHRTLDLTYTPASEANAAAVVEGKLDGVAMNTTNAARLYSTVLNIQIYEAYDKSTVSLAGSPTIKIAVERTDGEKHTLELYAVNDRRYAVVLNGNTPGYYAHRDAVNTMLNAFDCVDRGDTIPRV